MAKISVKRRNEAERKDGKAALYAYVCIERKKIRIPVQVAVSQAEWDPVGERVKGRSSEMRDKNLIISNAKAKISDALVRLRLRGEEVTIEKFWDEYNRPSDCIRFIDYARKRLNIIRVALQPQSLSHHITILNKIEAYAPNLELHEITPEWLRVYAAYLRDEHRNSPNTINKNMSVIRMHILAALREGKVKNNPFDVYKLPQAEPAIVYLTQEELDKLTKLYKSGKLPENEQEVLQFFLFMTFTAMHFNDALNLKIEQIHSGRIHYKRIKTGVKVSLPMSEPVKMLVELYRGDRYRGPLIQHRITNQCFNRLIKRICESVGIRKPVSAKTGRHTFATLFNKNYGNIRTLATLLGHKKLNSTMIYTHILEESQEEGVAVFNGML